MFIGYARVSTQDQETAAQIAALEQAGCERIFQEKASGGRWDRPEKWLSSFGQFFLFLKWKPCLFSGCLFNRRQHHGKCLVWCSFP